MRNTSPILVPIALLFLTLTATTCTASTDDPEKRNAYEGLSFKDGPNGEFFDACLQPGPPTKVSTFLEQDPDLVHAYTKSGETCLFLSASTFNIELVKLLVEKGADINARAKGEQNKRMTALGWHAISASPETSLYLIEQGADVNAEFDGLDETGTKAVGIFTALDLMEFMIDLLENDESADAHLTIKCYKKTKADLIANGARRFVGGDEM